MVCRIYEANGARAFMNPDVDEGYDTGSFDDGSTTEHTVHGVIFHCCTSSQMPRQPIGAKWQPLQ